MEHQEKDIKQSYDAKLMLRLLKFAKPQWFILLLSIVLMLFITGVDLLVPYVTKLAIDDYISPVTQPVYLDAAGEIVYPNLLERSFGSAEKKASGLIQKSSGEYFLIKDLNRGDDLTQADKTPLTPTQVESFKAYNKTQISLLTIILAIIMVINFAFSFFHTYLLHYASQKIVYTMREKLFSHIESMSLSFFDRNPVGRLVTRVSNDMENINEMFTNVIVTSLKDFLLLGSTVVVMALIDLKLAIVCLSTMPIVLIAASVFRNKARAVQRDVKVKIARINATLSENISGMKIIQIFNREKRILEDFDAINTDFLESSIQETKVYAVFRPIMNFAYSISLSLLLWFGGGEAISGIVELGVLVAFITYTQQFFRPIMDLSEKFNIFQSSMASAERIFMLLDEKVDIENPPEAQSVSDDTFKGHIAFKDVWFSYKSHPENDDDYVLKGISFEIKPGDTVALVGSTGSGKTTIISLLNRFYDIQKGEIWIDGVEIKSWHLDSLRSKIGIVLQDVFLFAGTINSNIRLHHHEISDSEIIEVAKYVNAHDFITRLKEGYSEPVTERGSTLSAGQRQLLSFARALVFDPKVLILDEATSNIDTETELLIQDAIQKIIKGRSTLIVAHRLSTIQHADQIIVMSKGEIREMGNHQTLLQKEGIYYDLYKLQYAEV